MINTFGIYEIPIYAVRSGAVIGGFSIPPSRRVSSIAISRDGAFLASGGEGPSIELWDFQSRKMMRQLLGLKTNVYGLAFGPGRGRRGKIRTEAKRLKKKARPKAKIVRPA